MNLPHFRLHYSDRHAQQRWAVTHCVSRGVWHSGWHETAREAVSVMVM
jgi:hypothetical protein